MGRSQICSFDKNSLVSKVVSEWNSIQSYLTRVYYTFQQFNPQLEYEHLAIVN